jgi:phage gp29-like protein
MLDTFAAKPKRGQLLSEVAVSKMLAFGTQVADPDELLAKAGVKRYQLAQLELDDEVAQCMDTRIEAVVATPWRLEPNENRLGKWLTSLLEPHIDQMKRNTIRARFYGYSVQEIVYEPVEKGIGIHRVVLKPMQWFAPQRDGTLRFFPDDGSGGQEGIEVDPIKFLLTVCNGTYNNPYGEALLSRLWFPVTWRREGWQMWLQFLETFGEPIILGAVPSYQEFVEAMQAQGVRSTVAWQSVTGDDKIETISASTPGEFDRLEQAILRRIQKLILGQTLTSDVGANGSYAVAAIHNEVRNDKRRADMRLVQATGQQLLTNLCRVNNLDPEKFKFIMADDSGLEMHRAQRDSVLSPILASAKLHYTKTYFMDRFDLHEEDLEMTEEVSDEAMNPAKEQEALDETGEEKPAVNDRSVADGEGQ